MRTVLQDEAEQFLSLRADGPCPLDETGRSPFEIFLMGFGHVLRHGRVSSPVMTSPMAGNSAPLEEDLDQSIGEPDIQNLMDQLIGSAVIMVVDFEMVIDIQGSFLPIGIGVEVNRERFQSRLIQGFKQNLAAGIEFLKWTIVENL